MGELSTKGSRKA